MLLFTAIKIFRKYLKQQEHYGILYKYVVLYFIHTVVFISIYWLHWNGGYYL